MSQYTHPLMIKHGKSCFDAMSVVDKTLEPCDAPGQPEAYPKGTCYYFDKKFCCPSAFDSLAKDIDDSNVDSSLFIQKRDHPCFGGLF